jgi:putative transposase
VWARLRFKEVRAPEARVLRLMREAQLIVPSRTLPKPENPHTSTIIIARRNEVWAGDHTMTTTTEEGQVTVFLAVGHSTRECVCLHGGQQRHAVQGTGTAAASSARLLRWISRRHGSGHY